SRCIRWLRSSFERASSSSCQSLRFPNATGRFALQGFLLIASFRRTNQCPFAELVSSALPCLSEAIPLRGVAVLFSPTSSKLPPFLRRNRKPERIVVSFEFRISINLA